jgi:hypothetical protein
MNEPTPDERPQGDPLVPNDRDASAEQPEDSPSDLPVPGQHDLDDKGDGDIGAGAD